MADKRRRLLVVAVDPEVFSRFPPLLWRSTFDVSAPQDPEVAIKAISETAFDLIICSYPVPGMDFIDFLDEVRGFGRPCRSSPLLTVAEPAELPRAAAFIGKGLNRLVSTSAPDLELERAAVDLMHIAPRSEVRIDVGLTATVKDRHRRLITQTLNLSRSGMLITDPGNLSVGERVDFQFRLPATETPVSGSGKVVRLDQRRRGVGVQFLDFSGSDHELLGEFIDALL